jgi:Family of unknown function (DUF6931)
MKDKNASEVCSHFTSGDAARRLLTPDLTAGKYLELLIQNKQYIDAVRVLAYALPIRDAITWANSCARQASEPNPAEKLSAALDAVDKWLAEPSDDNRRAAMKAAEQAEFSTPAGSSALAVFLSGGSLAPPGAPVVPPAEHQASHAVVGAVMLSALAKEPEKAEARYQAFLQHGQKVAADVKS